MSDEKLENSEVVSDIKKFVLNVPPIIMALDDTPFVLSRIEDILGDKYNLRLTKTPLAAFGALNKEAVDLMLLDIEMPGMSGIEFLEQARKNDNVKHTRVIFITAHAESDMVKKALKLGADGYIIKPIQADALLKKVEEVLGR
jgi:putative two-component system response regulator